MGENDAQRQWGGWCTAVATRTKTRTESAKLPDAAGLCRKSQIPNFLVTVGDDDGAGETLFPTPPPVLSLVSV